MRKPLLALVTILVAISLALSACGSSAGKPTPTATLSFEQLSTNIAGTVIADITANAPTATNTPTITETPTLTPTLSTPLATNTEAQPTSASCANFSFVGDVTIPDGTQMPIGTAFTKTWRVKNTGTCTWTKNFALIFSYGEKMGGKNVYFPADVPVGQETDVSVNLIVPNKNGKLSAVWALMDDKSQPFGPILTIVINVGALSPSPTGSATATDTPTATPTP